MRRKSDLHPVRGNNKLLDQIDKIVPQESFEQQQKLNVDITSVTSIEVKDLPNKPGELATVKESPESARAQA